MTQVLAADSRFLALELYRILKDIDAARWRNDLETAVRERLARLEANMPHLVVRAQQTAPHTDLPNRLAALSELLRDRVPHPHWPTHEEVASKWAEYRAQLITAYEDLARSLRTISVHVPSVRPTNYARNVFHVATAGLSVALIALVSSRGGLIALAAFFAASAWTMETSRRFSPRANEFLLRVFGKVAHPHERFHVNSATWYTTALLALALTVPLAAAMAAVGILGIADPAAALVGRRFGRIRLVHGRTLEGTLAFFVTGTLTALGLLMAFWSFHWTAALFVATCASLLGAIVELFSRRVDDNLSIPLAAGVGGWIALQLLPLL
ncbi:hypothetical protein KKC22_05105 [Myxococcota bacterium]|nr:hypothetical protein [Myxococcota bacterium]